MFHDIRGLEHFPSGQNDYNDMEKVMKLLERALKMVHGWDR